MGKFWKIALISVLVVSCSLRGKNGDDGSKGDKGDPGPRGPKGDKGEAGETYIPPIPEEVREELEGEQEEESETPEEELVPSTEEEEEQNPDQEGLISDGADEEDQEIEILPPSEDHPLPPLPVDRGFFCICVTKYSVKTEILSLSESTKEHVLHSGKCFIGANRGANSGYPELYKACRNIIKEQDSNKELRLAE